MCVGRVSKWKTRESPDETQSLAQVLVESSKRRWSVSEAFLACHTATKSEKKKGARWNDDDATQAPATQLQASRRMRTWGLGLIL